MGFFRRAVSKIKRTARNIFLLFLGSALSILVAFSVCVYYFREPIMKSLILGRISHVTGFKIKVKQFEHEFPLRFTLRGVTMYNHAGYQPRVFATSPYFYIDIDLKELLRGKLFYIHEWRVVIDKLNLERSKAGVVNGMLLKAIKNFARFNEPVGGPVRPSSLDFLMDRLELRIKTINYSDKSGLLRKKINNLHMDARVFENTTDFSLLMDTIEDEVLNQMAVTRRMELGPFFIERSLAKAGHAVKGTTVMMADGAGKVVKTTTSAPVVMTEKTGELLKSTVHFIGGIGIVPEKQKISEVSPAVQKSAALIQPLNSAAVLPSESPAPSPGPTAPAAPSAV
jgi:hypothetical protein